MRSETGSGQKQEFFEKDLHKTEVVQEARTMNNRSWVEEKRTVKFV